METDNARAAAGAPLSCDRAATAALLPFAELVDAIARAAVEARDGRITCPERAVLRMPPDGVLLSMPATADDVSAHKLVTVQPRNAERGLPTLHGLVCVVESATGRPLCVLDGPELTGRRTAAVSLLALRTLHPARPRAVLVIGTGVQATHHLTALRTMHPDVALQVRGSRPGRAEAFCARPEIVALGVRPEAAAGVGGAPDEIFDVVIAATSSTTPVYDEAPRAGRLVIGVGAFRPDMAELGPRTIAGSALFVDDPVGAPSEAGDLLKGGADWTRVRALADALTAPAPVGPVVFKSVGCAAWDLAAARVARSQLQRRTGAPPAFCAAGSGTAGSVGAAGAPGTGGTAGT